MSKPFKSISTRVQERFGDEALEAYNNLTKQEVIQMQTTKLFEGFDYRIEDYPNPNPNKFKINTYISNVRSILEGKCVHTGVEYEPKDYVSLHDFQVWWERKNGVVKDYWDYT